MSGQYTMMTKEIWPSKFTEEGDVLEGRIVGTDTLRIRNREVPCRIVESLDNKEYHVPISAVLSELGGLEDGTKVMFEYLGKGTNVAGLEYNRFRWGYSKG